ncbi:hypothetical protein ACIBG7_08210 [Nonomuraea sp. NPDC050328]|uniref:hypothetical protein n=1 Tax=Nonomuraea sp. NPDC050328 TaxID=3364361 RepID=UPI0037929B34
MRLTPEESQWALLTGAGVRGGFQAAWIEGDDLDAITAGLGMDPEERIECDLATAMRWRRPVHAPVVHWVGPHSPGWTFAMLVAGFEFDAALPGRQVYPFTYLYEIGEFYSVPGLEWDDERFADLALPDDMGDEECLDDCLVAVGRITGRFIDRGWLAEPRTLGRLTGGGW